MDQGKILLGLGAPFYRAPGGELLVEAQTASGLHAWKDHFDQVTAYAIAYEGAPPKGWITLAEAGLSEPEFELIALPNTYNLAPFSAEIAAASKTLEVAMKEVDYRVFAYGGWLGGPGELAVSIARKNALPYAVWLDRIESQVIWTEGRKSSLWKAWVKSAIVQYRERRAVKQAGLSLLHGATVFDHFKAFAKNPYIAENIHYSHEDRITAEALVRKIETCREGPLQIVYVGRAEPMKGGEQWLDALALLSEQGVDFHARWFGVGSELEMLRAKADRLSLTPEKVRVEGFVEDRAVMKAAYQEAHLLLFCHLTNESPRNLIESLHAAPPLVGYRDPFSENLVAEKGAGVLTERGDIHGLSAAVAALSADRENLADLIARAGQSASELTRERVFAHRSEIVKRELGKADV